MAETPHSNWSQLPKDLLHTISKTFTNTPLQILTLRSVCSSWRSSIPPFQKSPPLPLNLPFPIAPNSALNPRRRGHFSLTQSTIYILQNPNSLTSKSTATATASKSWLIRVEETREGKLRPLNPLSRNSTEHRPIAFPKALNLLDARITEIGKAYCLEFVETSKKNIDREFGELKSLLVKKAVVSSAPWAGNDDDYAVMAIHGEKLGFIKVGDGVWTLFDDPKLCDDVVYHKGKFYAVDYKGRTMVIGSDLKAKEVTAPFYGRGGGEFKHLVKSCDDLFLVDKYMGGQEIDFILGEYSECEFHLRVFKLNEEEKRWDSVDTLGDQVFFLGNDCSYAVRAKDFPGLRGNCVYFSDDSFDGENEALGEFCVDTGVYRMVDGKCGALSAFRRRSPIFWPPPSWLSSKSSGSKK